MDVTIVAAIIGAVAAVTVAVLGLIFGLYTYPNQKRIDRREELRKARGQAYTAYLEAYSDAERWNGIVGKEDVYAKALVAYSKAYSALFNIAKDDVFDATTKFHQFLWVDDAPAKLAPEEWREQWMTLYTEMLIKMRQDAFVEKSTLPRNVIEERLPWYFDWDPEEMSEERPPQKGVNRRRPEEAERTVFMTDNQARQDEVKRLKEEGLTDEEIASRLGITEGEVQEISAVVIKPPDEENGDG